MAERLNLRIDETGNQDLSEGRYLVAVVLHDHSADIEEAILIFDSLSYFQAFDAIAVYYDNGQGAVSAALHDALDFVLAKNVVDYRHADPNARRLLQVADYVCTVLRVSEDYDAGRQSKTHERVFGNRRNFTQSFKSSSIERRLRRSPVDAVASERLGIPRICWRANETDRVANSGVRAL